MGILVALSGLDGSGKTTQGKLIKELCITNGIKAHYVHLKTIDTKEVYFKVSAKAKAYMKENHLELKEDRNALRNIISALLFYEKVENEVLVALSSYDVVIVDRYIDSAICYHLLENGDYRSVEKIYAQIKKPDINVFLDLGINTCCERIKQRNETTKYENEESFKVAYSYYSSRKEKFMWLDANQDRDVIAKEIFNQIINKISEGA